MFRENLITQVFEFLPIPLPDTKIILIKIITNSFICNSNKCTKYKNT